MMGIPEDEYWARKARQQRKPGILKAKNLEESPRWWIPEDVEDLDSIAFFIDSKPTVVSLDRHGILQAHLTRRMQAFKQVNPRNSQWLIPLRPLFRGLSFHQELVIEDFLDAIAFLECLQGFVAGHLLKKIYPIGRLRIRMVRHQKTPNLAIIPYTTYNEAIRNKVAWWEKWTCRCVSNALARVLNLCEFELPEKPDLTIQSRDVLRAP